ncbi:chromosome segregation protein SMC [Flammeovirgaceae bacterium SG7u.111]|nr:chromosome segregation protein SMC [Flammeovirgaceae bacterium SG7u.132]WPO38558.1 chromosome segregation protein SMC [Flammeovirgaceae bacterium SG7u.111]
MLLQKLEIKGFKSFGDRVVFNFDEGVTAVVGPNGSGKSNVVDAIRWVLGEQSSKALRSDKMENVIFNGTKNRRALQMAEVSLSFKNTKNLLPTEYSEVTISRRYYRSGESEYLLNGVSCRLKDIQTLFLDTGIGSDSYAIIELKMVDEILNDQNQSRRGLFEEAAGISKFKKRKKETLKKLSDTNADLERVEDLVFEIEKNMRSLERQAKQAERYLKMKEEYRRLSLQLAKKSVSAQIDLLESLNQRINAETDRQHQIESQLAQFDAEIEKEQASLIQKEKLLSSRQKTLNEHVHKIRQFESEKKIKNERLKFLTERATKLQNQLDEDVKSSDRAKFSLEGLVREQEQLEKILRETEFLVEQLKKEYEEQKQKTTSLKTTSQELDVRIQSKQASVFHQKKTLEINQVQINSLKQELERESENSTESTANLEDFDAKIAEFEGQLKVKKERLQSLQQKQTEIDAQIKSNEASLQSLQQQQAKTLRELDAKQNEYSLTKSMLDNLEGYPQAIKFLKKNTPWGKNAPLLSDIITCDEKYRVAVENYLEPYLNYYVLENEAQAFEAVNMLSDAAKGKGNFLLLDEFKHYKPSSQKQFEDAISALDIVEYDEKYKALAYYLLEKVYVVTENQDHLPSDDELVFITQNGKIIKQKYTISGGSVGLFEGKKIGRAKNIDKLALRIKELQVKNRELDKIIEERQNDLASLKENLPREDMLALQEEINLLGQEYATVKTRKEQFISLLQDKENRREAITEKIAQLTDSVHQTAPQLEDDEKELVELKEQYDYLRDDLEQENEALAQKSAAFNQQNILFHQQSNKLESTEKEIEYKETSFERGNARIDNNKSELKHTEDEIRHLQESSGDNEQLLIEMYAEKEGIEGAVNEAEKEYYNSRGNISEIEKQTREVRQKKDSIGAVMMELKEKVSNTRMEMSSVKERISVEFDLDFEEMLENTEVIELTVEYLREEVTKIKERMDKMGAINHMAIEAYNEIKERHDFILEQKEDLEKAIASLEETISEIDTVAKENFMAAFLQIREDFKRVFRSLFTQEDSCDLILVDESDPLNSKIEIIAQPKGKKPLTINQLSGGEKTLTATALLFSIYLLKPAPFCIFDEVDAPLDDANIDKFNNIIKEFSKNSQFIVVTHNKRTMSSTDVIYGVTMVEQGVSTVVAVDLKTIEDQ